MLGRLNMPLRKMPATPVVPQEPRPEPRHEPDSNPRDVVEAFREMLRDVREANQPRADAQNIAKIVASEVAKALSGSTRTYTVEINKDERGSTTGMTVRVGVQP
jgi:hypothetical protein